MRNQAKQRGFGLMEVLIAASIMALVAGSVVALATNSINMSILGANRTSAYQLSQEGVELVRELRDTTYIDGNPNAWNDLFDPSCRQNGCKIVRNSDTTLALTSGSEDISLATGTATTVFTRTITIKPIDWYTEANTTVPNYPKDIAKPSLALQVVSSVSWNQKGRQIVVNSSTILSDWRSVQ